MTLAEVSIRRPVFAWMLMFGLILFGWFCFRSMGVSQLPDVDFPVVNVSVSYEGAAPEVIESNLVDPIESAITSVQGVRSISSSSRFGSANITVEFELEKNIDVVLQEVQTKISQAQRNFPKNIDPPIVTKTNPEDQPIIWLAARSDQMKPKELMSFVRDQLKDKFSTVPGVGEVFLGGYVEPNLRIWLSNEKLNKYELTVGDILTTLNNEHTELPAGQIQTERREIDVRTLGEAKSVKDFENLIITERGGRPNFANIRLGDVATIEEGLADVRRMSRSLGQTAIGIGIRKQRGSNAVEVAKLVKAKMSELQKTIPNDVQMAVNFDSTKFIEDSVHELNFTLVLSAVLTGLVCWFFLGSFSATFNVLFAIPTSIIGAFIALKFLGFTLNTFTLLGLSLAVGIVVDDAIMVLENIVRHRELGKSRFQAALDGTNEISFAALAATLSIIAIFLPVVFMRGAIGKFFFQFGITLTVTVALSLLEALTLTPMRSSKYVDVTKRTTAFGRGIENLLAYTARSYRNALYICLRYRVLVLVASAVFFAASIMSVKTLNKEFIPAQDQGAFIIRLQTPSDSSLNFTNLKFLEAEKIISEKGPVLRYYAAIGGFGGGDVNSGIIFVTMKERGQRGLDPEKKKELTQQEFMNSLRTDLSKVKDLKAFMQDLSMRGFSASRGFPVEFAIRGPEWNVLAEQSEILKKKLEETGMMTDIDSDYRIGKPEIDIIPNRERAAARGVSVRSISETVSTMVGGVVSGKFSIGGHRNDIRVRLRADERDRAEQIKSLFVRNNRGELVRLSDLITIEERKSLQQISRQDRERAITLFANLKTGASQAAVIQKVEEVAKATLPSGYRAVMKGSAETFNDSMKDLRFALIMGLIVAYMVLASQFNSFIDPITILLALPFSLSGAFLALSITHLSINIFSFIGIILLMGIVKKNSILLIEFTHQMREHEKLPVREALLKACPIRLRPILMTSIASIVGALPSALAIGPGAETRVPMAVAVIGGVLVSTLLTLFVVPSAYSLFASIAEFKLNKKNNNPQIEPPASKTIHLICIAVLASSNALASDASNSLPFQQPSSSEAITLTKAIQISLNENPVVLSARQKLSESRAQYGLARSFLLPQIKGTLDANTKKDAVLTSNALFGGENYNKYTFEISGSQALFTYGMWSALKLPSHDESIQELEVEKTERRLSREVIESYYTLVLAQEKLRFLQENEKLSTDLSNSIEKRRKIGRNQTIDLLQANTEKALIIAKRAKAENDLQTYATKLAGTLGKPTISDLKVSGRFPKTLELERVLSRFPFDVQQKDLLVEINQMEIEKLLDQRSVALGSHVPSLQAKGSWSRNAYTKSDLLDSASTSWVLGLELSIPLFSGLSSVYERRSLTSKIDTAELVLSASKNDALLKKTQSLEQLKGAFISHKANLSAAALAKESLTEAGKLFSLSTIDFVQFVSIEQSALEADLAVIDSRITLLVSLLDYIEFTGYSMFSFGAFLEEK